MSHDADVGFAWSERREVKSGVGGDNRSPNSQRYSALCVRFPPTKLNTHSAAPEFVEHHPGRARVHRVVPKEPAYGIERAIHVVDTIINPNLIAILGPIFGHTSIRTRRE